MFLVHKRFTLFALIAAWQRLNNRDLDLILEFITTILTSEEHLQVLYTLLLQHLLCISLNM